MNRYFKLNNKIKMKEQYFVRIAASLVLLSVFNLANRQENNSEAGTICGTAEKRAEGIEGNGDGLPKWWEKVGYGCMCSTSWRFPA